MTPGSIAILVFVCLIFAGIIAGWIVDKVKGKSGCCGSCKGCAMSGQCHPKDEKKQ